MEIVKKDYTGQTGRAFNTRVKVHIKSFNNKTLHSNYAKHLLEFQQDPDPNFKTLNTQNISLFFE